MTGYKRNDLAGWDCFNDSMSQVPSCRKYPIQKNLILLCYIQFSTADHGIRDYHARRLWEWNFLFMTWNLFFLPSYVTRGGKVDRYIVLRPSLCSLETRLLVALKAPISSPEVHIQVVSRRQYKYATTPTG